MNRRDFLRRGAMTVVAVSVAPAAALSLDKFAVGGVVGVNPGIMVGEMAGETIIPTAIAKAMQDYYQIQWPVSNQTYEFGTYIGGLMEHRADFDENGTAWVPKELEGRSDLSYTYVDPACDRLPMFGRLEFYNCEISDLKVNDGSALLSPDNA